MRVLAVSLICTILSAAFAVGVFAEAKYAAQSENQHAGHGHGGGGGGADEAPIFGQVVETMNSGGYTYMLLASGGQELWVAAREMKVKVGENVALRPGVMMEGFTSKTLNKTFKTIVFSDGPLAGGGAGAHGGGDPHGGKYGTGHLGAAPDPKENTTGGSKTKTPKMDRDVHVDKAPGANGYTVMELFEKRSELNLKEVALRGKVVKVSAEIMGKNWLHIQDGTGYAQNSTNDIVVTTKDLPAVGDVVLINGTMFENKDFGSGYKYDAIIEKAKVIKE